MYKMRLASKWLEISTSKSRGATELLEECSMEILVIRISLASWMETCPFDPSMAQHLPGLLLGEMTDSIGPILAATNMYMYKEKK